MLLFIDQNKIVVESLAIAGIDESIHIHHQGKEVFYEEINPQVLQKIRMDRRLAEYISMNTEK